MPVQLRIVYSPSTIRPVRMLVLASVAALTAVLCPGIANASPASATRAFDYAGIQVSVPADWPVVDLAGGTGCVRYDEHAVYLGTPATADCPSRVIGHVETVQMLPAGSVAATPAEPAVTLPGGALLTGGTDVHPDIIVSDPNSAAQVVVTSGSDTQLAREIAASVRFPSPSGVPLRSARNAAFAMPATAPATAPTTAPALAASTTPFVSTLTGLGFDTCTAPSLATMSAWRASPYKAVGIYVGGAVRGCAQPNLTANWAGQVMAMGWRLLPLYVGRQAPCTTYKTTIDLNPSTAASQGSAAAADAVASMAALGFGPGLPVYFDLEYYSIKNTACSAAVMAFLDAWTAGLHVRGYVSGVYSSTDAAIVDMANRWNTAFHQPDAVWMARWNNQATTSDSSIPASYWSQHQRIHQYTGGHKETYAGVTLNIDSSAVDAPVVASSGAPWLNPPPPYPCLASTSATPPPTTTTSAPPTSTSATTSTTTSPSSTTTTSGSAPTGTTTSTPNNFQAPGGAPAQSSPLVPRIAGVDRFDTARMIAQYAGSGNSVVIANGENAHQGVDALSASYFAGQVGAPILLTRTDTLPAATAEAVCEVLKGPSTAQRTVYIVGGDGAVSAAVAAQLANVYHPRNVTVRVARIAGADRYQTSAAIGTVSFANPVGSYTFDPALTPVPTAILASGEVSADALSAGPISAEYRIPILLTQPDALSPSVAQALTTLGIQQVIVLGGTVRVSAAIVTALQNSGIMVRRIAGADRYDTAALLNSFARQPAVTVTGSTGTGPSGGLGQNGTLAVLANGLTGFPDALTAGPYLARSGDPLLLVPPDALPTSTASFLAAQQGGITAVQALGGPVTVAQQVLDDANALLLQ